MTTNDNYSTGHRSRSLLPSFICFWCFASWLAANAAADRSPQRRLLRSSKHIEWGRSLLLNSTVEDDLVNEDSWFWSRRELDEFSLCMSLGDTKPPTSSPTDPPSHSPDNSSTSPTVTPFGPIASWNQVGDALPGDVVSMSHDGQVLAARDYDNDRVQVYQRQNQEWMAMGGAITLPPLAPEDEFSFFRGISLSGNGRRVAVASLSGGGGDSLEGGQRPGLLRVFEFVEESWIQMGQDLIGDDPLDELGLDVSLSFDGDLLVAGAPLGPNRQGPGYVGVFRYDSQGAVWSSIQKLFPENVSREDGSGFGSSLRLTGDGRRLIVGMQYYSPGGLIWAGRFSVHEWQESPSVGFVETAHIDGNVEADNFGLAVDISDDGQTVAASAISSFGLGPGMVKVYRFANSEAELEDLGEPILGESDPNNFGGSFALSRNGNLVAIGDSQFLTEGEGYVKVVEWNGVEWERVGPLVKIPSNIQHSSFGRTVSISKDGSNLAAAWRDSDGNRRIGTFDALDA